MFENIYQLKRLVLIIIGTITWGILSPASLSAETKNIITANEFRLLDQRGKIRAGLKLENGRPVIFLADEKQKARAFLALTSNGTLLSLRDKNGKMRAYLSCDDTGYPTIGILGPEKKIKVIISLVRDNVPIIVVSDRNGVGRMTLALKPDGSPAIGMLGPDKQSRLHIQAPENRGPMITMHPGSDRPAVVLGLIHQRPVLTLYTRYRNGVVAGVNQAGEPVLGLMRNGQTTWTPAGAASPSAGQDLERAVDELLR